MLFLVIKSQTPLNAHSKGSELRVRLKVNGHSIVNTPPLVVAKVYPGSERCWSTGWDFLVVANVYLGSEGAGALVETSWWWLMGK